MLDIQFTTFYSEMHGHDHKILKITNKKITTLKHSIKIQYFLALALFQSIYLKQRVSFISQIASADFSFITVTKCFMTL